MIKLYEKDVYLTSAEAELIEEKDGGYLFSQTIFAPEAGGQFADKGTINGIQVIDVKEKDDQIIHYLEEKLNDDHVTMHIEWAHRLDQMQQHCGEHILSGIIKKEYDGNNKGFHMGKEYVTIDLDCKITDAMLDTIEDLANQAIYNNIELKFEYTNTIEELNQPIRKDATVMKDIRVVTIPGVDCVACCGTHPKRTGDVGLIKLYKVEKNKAYSRIYFKCGKRALDDARRKTKIVQTLNQQYSSDDSTLLDRMSKEKDKYENIKKTFIELNRSLIDDQIKQDIDDQKTYQKFVIDYLPSQDMNYVIKKVSEKINSVILVYSKSENKIMLSHDGSHDVHCGELFRSIKSYHGKGGGNQKVAQGVFENLEDGMHFMEVVEKEL